MLRLLTVILVGCALASTSLAQAPRAEVEVFAGPFVKIQNGNDKTTYDGSFATGVRLTTGLRNGASVQLGYTFTDVSAIRSATAVAASDTLDARMLELNVTARAGRWPAFRLEPVIGFAIYQFEPSRGFFTSGVHLAISPAPTARLKPWVGIDAKYYGLRPFIDDGLYLVAVTGSVDL